MWTTSEYSVDDMDGIVAMAKENYGDENDITDPEYLRWQYELNPAGPALIKIARNPETDELAGQYVVAPARFSAGSEVVRATLSLNTLTRAQYRGQGIFTKLAESVYSECVRQEFAFTYGMPNQNSYPGFVRRLAFADIGHLPLMLAILRPGGVVWNRLRRRSSQPSAPTAVRDSGHADLPDNICELTSENIALLDEFWQAVRMKYPLIGVRDSAYMKWRYLTIPRRTYRLLAYLDQGRMLGYVVTREAEVDGIPSGMIVDILFLPGAENAGRTLIRTALRHFKRAGMHLSGALVVEGCEEQRLLTAAGFFRCPKQLLPQPFPVIYREHAPNYPSAAVAPHLHNWFLTMGDYDVI